MSSGVAHPRFAAGHAHWYSCAARVEVCGRWSNHRDHYWSSILLGGLPWLLSVNAWDIILSDPHLLMQGIQQVCGASTNPQIRSGPNDNYTHVIIKWQRAKDAIFLVFTSAYVSSSFREWHQLRFML